MLDIFIINTTWSVKDGCLYCMNIHNRPILRLDNDCYLINFNIGYLSELKKIIPQLHRLDKPYYFVKLFAKQERNMEKKGSDIIKEDIHNAITTYALNPKLYDLFQKNNIDFIKILTDYITEHNSFDIFKEVYPILEKELIKRPKYVYPHGNVYSTINPIAMDNIERDDIRNEIMSLERIVNLNKLLL